MVYSIYLPITTVFIRSRPVNARGQRIAAVDQRPQTYYAHECNIIYDGDFISSIYLLLSVVVQ